MATKSESKGTFSMKSLFVTKDAYKQIASEFHPFHKHDLNVACHVWTTGLGLWGAFQLAKCFGLDALVYVYGAAVALTCPIATALLHTAFVAAMMVIPQIQVTEVPLEYDDRLIAVAAIVLGYGLQDVSHWLFAEKTYMSTYIGASPMKLVIHSFWLMPLVIDSVLMRYCFLPKLFVTRNRCVVTDMASTKAIAELRQWIHKNVPETNETTHVWPHAQEGTSANVKQLEDDAALYAAFRTVFAPHHFDIKPIVGMNEIYVTAVGAKKQINSDAVFYTPHVDGPYFWLPFASVYRCLVGVTPNEMVCTRFNLQHDTQDQVLTTNGMIGFDYNRELHWIDHIPGKSNKERRSVIKLHYVVYPKGWEWYGDLVAKLNQNYNTWARQNFLRTLRPAGVYEYVLAWWIWLTTWTNSYFEEHVGWANAIYVAACYFLGPTPFLILTSFRHYMIYMSTFAFREPMVAHGNLMRDAKFFKTVALTHLGSRLLPLIELPGDIPGVLLATLGFGITILATAQLGFVRTYFGSELGFVKPKWIEGFPYNTIPHPMIVGQLVAYSNILYWFHGRLTFETTALIATHMSFYTAHMIQEMLTSSY